MSSAIKTPAFQAKAGNIQNEDGSSIYSNGDWSLKNSTAVASVTIKDAGRVGVLATSPRGVLDLNTTREAKIYLGTAGVIGETQSNAGDYIANNLFVSAETAGTMTYTKTTGDSGNAIVQDFSRGITFYSGVTGAASSTGTLNNFERMRIDANGNLLVNKTSANDGTFHVRSLSTGARAIGVEVLVTSNHEAISFRNPNGIVGSINTNGLNTAFLTSSDYRLKEDVKPMVAALSKVAALKPCTYKWKIDGSEGEGFIAHELAEVCPAAVSGEKDAVNEDGSIKLQGIDPSKLIGLLTAAIQELSAKVEAQAAEIEALKAK